MIRVLHVIGAMDRGGAETLIMNLYRAVDKSKVQFDFLVHEQRECDYDNEILEMGGRIYRLPRFVGTNYFSYKKACDDFFAEHPEYRIVHGHIGSCAAIYLSAAKKHNMTAIAHSHAQNYEPGLGGLAFRVLSYPTRNIADYFLACSEEAGKDRFGDEVAEGKRFFLLNNGIDLNRYQFDQGIREAKRAELRLGDAPVFGHVGRLDFEKNHEFLFGVFSKILETLPDARLLLAGRGPLEDDLKRKADEMGIAKSVMFLGVREDIPELLKAFDVFLFPSIKEGLPVASVEAQATGLPVALSTGVPEMAVVSNRTVRIPLEDGEDAWAQWAISAYRDHAEGDSCDEVRSHGFDIADSAQWLVRFYEQIL